jgi:hypothetical protein
VFAVAQAGCERGPQRCGPHSRLPGDLPDRVLPVEIGSRALEVAQEGVVHQAAIRHSLRLSITWNTHRQCALEHRLEFRPSHRRSLTFYFFPELGLGTTGSVGVGDGFGVGLSVDAPVSFCVAGSGHEGVYGMVRCGVRCPFMHFRSLRASATQVCANAGATKSVQLMTIASSRVFIILRRIRARYLLVSSWTDEPDRWRPPLRPVPCPGCRAAAHPSRPAAVNCR